MATLNENWLTENLIDFEYKKYMLLAYLQEVSENFDANKLYPFLSDIVKHHKNLLAIKENKNSLYNSFPERLAGADTEKFRLFYEKIIKDDALMAELENIIDYSLPHFESYLAEGKKIYDFIESHFYITPVGIIPLQLNRGYMFLANADKKSAHVYEYEVTIFSTGENKLRGINTQHLLTFERTLTNTFESVKTDLIRTNPWLNNPATYAIETDITIPVEQTFLPIAKRSILKVVIQNDTGKEI